MKTLVFKTLIFGLLSISILSLVLDPVFRENNLNDKTFYEFYKSYSDSLDVLIVGSSHAKSTYNPSIIDSVFNTRTYNLGTGGQNYLFTNLLLEEVLKKTTPKLIIVDLFPSVIRTPTAKKGKSDQLRVIDYTSFSINKFNLLNKVYSIKELPSVYSETIRNHNKWYDSKGKGIDLTNKNFVFNQGHANSNRVMKEDLKEHFKFYLEKHNDFLNIMPTENAKAYFKAIISKEIIKTIEICEKHNTNVLFVSSPYFDSFYEDRLNFRHASLDDFFKDKSNVNFIDFNKKFKKIGLTLDDFWDKGHVNRTGAIKVTTGLIQELSKMGLLKPQNTLYFDNLVNKIEPRYDEDTMANINTNNNIEEIINRLKLKGVGYEVKHNFIKNLAIEKIYFGLDDVERIVIFESNESFEKLENYYFLLSNKINKIDFDERPKWQLGTNKNKLHWEAIPEFSSQNGKNYLLFRLDKKCEIINFDEVRIVLKDKLTKNSVVNGKPLVLNNVKSIN